MKRLRVDFAKRNDTHESWYDLREDWSLIESSMAKQYGMRLRHQVDMPWTEFCTLVSGLMPDTPLGQIITIRSEKDQKVIKGFAPDQRRIYRDWRMYQAKQKLNDPKKLDDEMNALACAFRSMFGKKEVNV